MYPPKIGIERTFLYYVKALDKLQKSINCKFMNYICTLSKNILPKKRIEKVINISLRFLRSLEY